MFVLLLIFIILFRLLLFLLVRFTDFFVLIVFFSILFFLIVIFWFVLLSSALASALSLLGEPEFLVINGPRPVASFAVLDMLAVVISEALASSSELVTISLVFPAFLLILVL